MNMFAIPSGQHRQAYDHGDGPTVTDSLVSLDVTSHCYEAYANTLKLEANYSYTGL